MTNFRTVIMVMILGFLLVGVGLILVFPTNKFFRALGFALLTMCLIVVFTYNWLTEEVHDATKRVKVVFVGSQKKFCEFISFNRGDRNEKTRR